MSFPGNPNHSSGTELNIQYLTRRERRSPKECPVYLMQIFRKKHLFCIKPFESFEDYEIYYDILDANENIIGSLIELFVVLNFEKIDILNMYKKEYNRICG